MATGFPVTTPRLAHELAWAAGMDAANHRMQAGGRQKWNRADYNLAAETTQRWYRNFNLLNHSQWMPAGYEWRRVAGSWRPAKIRLAST